MQEIKIIKGAKLRIYLVNHQIKVAYFYFRMKVYLTNLIYRYLIGYSNHRNKPTKKATCDFIRRLMRMRRFRIFQKIQQDMIFLIVLNSYDAFYHSFEKTGKPPSLLSIHQNRIVLPVPVISRTNLFELFDSGTFDILIDGIGKAKVKGSNVLEGKLLRCQLSMIFGKEFYVSFAYETMEKKVNFSPKPRIVGIDAGIHDMLIFSNGKKIKNPKFSKKYKTRIANFQKHLLKKEKGSSNHRKLKIKIAKCYKKIDNQRRNFIHRITSEIVHNFDIICIEDLDLRGLREKGKKHYFGKGCMRAYDDACLSEFYRQLEYKCRFYQNKLVKVPTYFPSSQICSCCGYQNPELSNPKIKIWQCPSCHKWHERDVNAAINIEKYGKSNHK